MIALDFVAALSLAAPSPPARPITAPQADPGDLVARFVIDGEKRTISRAGISLHLAHRHRNSSTGKSALEHLIDVALVRQAATAQGLMPTRDELKAKVHQMEIALKERKRSLPKVLKRFRMSRQEFVETTALGLAKKRLAAKVLRLKNLDKVTAEHLELWSREQRGKVKIVTDPTALPPGVLARVGPDEITELDLGRVLFTKIKKGPLEVAVQEMVFRQCIEREAKRHGIEITPADREKEYAHRQRAFEAGARSQGVKFEQWLEALGSSKREVIDSPDLLATLRHGKLVRKLYPDTMLAQTLEEAREAMMRRHGARRSMSVIFIRATDRPNQIVKRDFKAALQRITATREAIVEKKQQFAFLARTTSEDTTTATSGGRVGWQHREYLPGDSDQKVPDEVLPVAFGTQIGQISAPLRTKNGYYIVWVSGIEPEPSKKRLFARMLGEMAGKYNRKLFDAAKIEIVLE